MIKFSVIVPTYKRDEKLERALESIISQTYTDFELIVVDDNPEQEDKEKVKEIVESLDKDIDLERHINDNAQGVSSARNLGIQNASGKYIAFLDDDDEWKPEKLEKEAEDFKQNNYDAVYSAIEAYRDGEVQDIVRKEEKLGLEQILERDKIGSPSKVSVKKEVLEEINGFDEDIPSGEDWDLWIRLIENEAEFGYINEPLVRYHQSDDSKSSQVDVATEGREKITEKHSDLLEKAGSKVKARHHLNRAKKQYTLRDNRGTEKHLSKTIRNNSLELEAYALFVLYLFRRLTGKDLINIAVKVKRVFK
ncbi:glycosyltransferase family 2 protein [Candidatus Nanohalobium constans]|uniref:Glycosyl transferase family 2 n=1 Tax=Candidatus Nanohalobium constans TaxID=2565781 RepID=A0A5Q0UIU4_9ARCH|nr:glycosyltransferase family A protein [Candidatus Nanohalobium constans]QGA81060.1 glycosyl transferase family 2 [Candidatus Nanohalobium constans]